MPSKGKGVNIKMENNKNNIDKRKKPKTLIITLSYITLLYFLVRGGRFGTRGLTQGQFTIPHPLHILF